MKERERRNQTGELFVGTGREKERLTNESETDPQEKVVRKGINQGAIGYTIITGANQCIDQSVNHLVSPHKILLIDQYIHH